MKLHAGNKYFQRALSWKKVSGAVSAMNWKSKKYSCRSPHPLSINLDLFDTRHQHKQASRVCSRLRQKHPQVQLNENFCSFFVKHSYHVKQRSRVEVSNSASKKADFLNFHGHFCENQHDSRKSLMRHQTIFCAKGVLPFSELFFRNSKFYDIATKVRPTVETF